jgi:hypothetical protein
VPLSNLKKPMPDAEAKLAHQLTSLAARYICISTLSLGPGESYFENLTEELQEMLVSGATSVMIEAAGKFLLIAGQTPISTLTETNDDE